MKIEIQTTAPQISPLPKMTIEHEPGNPLVIDTSKRSYIVATPTGYWGRSPHRISDAACAAIRTGADVNETALAITIIGDDEAFIMDGGYINYAANAINAGTVQVASLGALVTRLGGS